MVNAGQQIPLAGAGVYLALKPSGRDSSKADNSDGNPELLSLTHEGHTVMLQGLRWDILKFFLNGLSFSILAFLKQTR